MRTVVGALVVVLGIAVFLAWPRPSSDETSEETTVVTSSTTERTNTTSRPTTTTETSHVVETVEEAEQILRDLWFGWFEGIYDQDENRIREVVILEETVETARASFGTSFDREPRPSDIEFRDIELLRSDEACLAVWSHIYLTGFRQGDSNGVDVIRWTAEGWKRLSAWIYRDDLWKADCESSLQPSSS